MKLFNKRQPEDVYQWLVIATKGLIPSAQDRIRSEILAHYAESVEAHQTDGLMEIASRKMALADLGDPYAAQKNFRKRYLSCSESKRLHGMLARRPMRVVQMAYGYWLGTIAIYERNINFVTPLLFLALLPIASYFLLRANKRRTVLFALVGNSFSISAFLFMLADVFFPSLMHRWQNATCGAILVWVLISSWRVIRLGRKLPRNWPESLEGQDVERA